MDGKIEKKLIFVPLIFAEIKFRKSQKIRISRNSRSSLFSFSPLYFSFFLSLFFFYWLLRWDDKNNGKFMWKAKESQYRSQIKFRTNKARSLFFFSHCNDDFCLGFLVALTGIRTFYSLSLSKYLAKIFSLIINLNKFIFVVVVVVCFIFC